MLITPECSQDGSSSPTRHPREQSHYPLAFRHYYSSTPLLACTDTDRRATGVQVICSGHRCFPSSSQPTQDTLPSERQQKSLSFLLLSLFFQHTHRHFHPPATLSKSLQSLQRRLLSTERECTSDAALCVGEAMGSERLCVEFTCSLPDLLAPALSFFFDCFTRSHQGRGRVVNGVCTSMCVCVCVCAKTHKCQGLNAV